MSKFAVPASLLALLALGAATSPVLARDARAFSFPDAAYYNPGDATRAADAFIERELPAGIPLASAEGRLHAAGMGCRDGSDGTSAICNFYTLAGGDGGTLGEAWYTIHLQADLDGHLTDARYDQARVGAAP